MILYIYHSYKTPIPKNVSNNEHILTQVQVNKLVCSMRYVI